VTNFLRDSDGTFKWNVVGWMVYVAFIQVLIFSGVMLTFSTSYKADLNPGIASTIWSTSPFVQAVVDYLIWSVELKPYHYVGMSLMLSCGIIISISNIIVPQDEVDLFQVQTLPTWVPVLTAMACNVVFSLNMTAGKYVTI
jgi:drug/metabolite transporter (DMT)-like permease